jgi:hypothetical protein
VKQKYIMLYSYMCYLPVTLAKGVQTKLISNFSSVHCIWKILLVSKHKQHSIT